MQPLDRHPIFPLSRRAGPFEIALSLVRSTSPLWPANTRPKGTSTRPDGDHGGLPSWTTLSFWWSVPPAWCGSPWSARYPWLAPPNDTGRRTPAQSPGDGQGSQEAASNNNIPVALFIFLRLPPLPSSPAHVELVKKASVNPRFRPFFHSFQPTASLF